MSNTSVRIVNYAFYVFSIGLAIGAYYAENVLFAFLFAMAGATLCIAGVLTMVRVWDRRNEEDLARQDLEVAVMLTDEDDFQDIQARIPTTNPPAPSIIPTVSELRLEGIDPEIIENMLAKGRARYGETP